MSIEETADEVIHTRIGDWYEINWCEKCNEQIRQWLPDVCPRCGSYWNITTDKATARWVTTYRIVSHWFFWTREEIVTQELEVKNTPNQRREEQRLRGDWR